MILNVLNKKLNSKEMQYFKKLSSMINVVNIDFQNLNNNEIKVNLSDIERDEREILIDANNALGIVFWGFPKNDDYKMKVFHSLLERENVYFVALDEEDLIEYENLKNELPDLFSRLINNYLREDGDGDNFRTLEEITKVDKSKSNSVVAGLKEIFTNRHMIWKMAYSIFQQETLKTTLGSYWHIIRDIVFFITYVLFMIFMRGFGEVEGIPVIMYLVSGLVAWYYMSDVINGGAACIKNSRGIISKVKFPVTIIPIYHAIAIFYRRGLTYIILAIVVAIYMFTNAKGVEVHIFKFIYYTFAMIMFMFAFNILLSALIAISRDFHELYKSFVRIQMYFNPIFWDITSVQNKLESINSPLAQYAIVPFKILMLNPSIYILTGYRESFGSVRGNTLFTTLVFWGIMLIMFGTGFKLQARVRSLYADII